MVARGRSAEQRGGSPAVMLGGAAQRGETTDGSAPACAWKATIRGCRRRRDIVRWGSAVTKDKRASDTGRSRGR
jgi:hypothetical protein